MQRFALVCLLVLVPAFAGAAELQQKSVAFLSEIGVNPASSEVRLIVNDQVDKYSLDYLAARRDEDGVKAFIATRNFIRKFRKNTKTPYPPAPLYQIYYLSKDEKTFISNEIIKSFKK